MTSTGASATSRCDQTTKAGKACRNTASYEVRPPLIDADHSDQQVCGTHVNSLWLWGWKCREFGADGWDQRQAARSGDVSTEPGTHEKGS